MLKHLLDRPIAVTMVLIVVIILGMVSLNLLPVSLIPKVDIPYITIQVKYPTQSARELDESIMKPLRQQLLQMPSLTDIRTETSDGVGTITLSFEHGVNTDFLFIEANERIDRMMGSFPRDMERPNVIKANATDIPAFYINLSIRGDEHYTTDNDLFPVSDKFTQLSEFVTNVIIKRIEQLPEVAMVDQSGYVSPEVLIIPDRDKLHEMNVQLYELENALRSANVSLGSLTIRDGEYQYNVSFQRNASNKQDIEDIYLNLGGRIYQIKDLASVVQHPQKRRGMVISDGKNAISLAVIKQSEAKMADLQNSIQNLMSHFTHDYPEIDFTVTRDQTELLDYSINNLIQNVIIGILLACLVIFLFMQSLRSAFLVVLTIPVALILSMLIFYTIGLTINIISISGLILGAGMMVDNSIIVIDNITFRWSSHMPLRKAVVEGTKEVFMPMLSSVLTTCAVFVPLVFLSGIAGALFYDQAMAVVISLFTSLFTTVTLIPVYYYLMYRRQTQPSNNRFLSRLSFDRVIRIYDTMLIALFRHRWFMWSCFAVAIVGTTILFIEIRKDRLPEITYQDTLLNIDWNDRITLEENERRVRLLLDQIQDQSVQQTAMIGNQQFALSHTRAIGSSEAIIYVKERAKGNLDRIKASVREFMQVHYPTALFSFEVFGNIFDMVFADNQAQLVARLRPTNGLSADLEQLNVLLAALSPKLQDVEIEPVACQEYILYRAKPEIMTLYGISYDELINAVQNALNARQLFTIMQGRFSVPVVMGDNESQLKELLQNATISKNGTNIPVSLFLEETRGQDMKTITSGPEGTFYPLNLNLEETRVPAAMDTIRKTVMENEHFEVSFSGSYFSNREMVKELSVILVIAILLLYFILASQFESIIQPLIILSEIVMNLFFTMLVLWGLDLSLNIMSLIGIIVTCGIVINDSILKIDTINRLRQEGMSLIHAIIEAGRRRLKPIIMTSLTTILAIVPFLVRGDMGSDLQYPLSLTVIVGMTTGTLVSVLFVPLVYYTIYKKK